MLSKNSQQARRVLNRIPSITPRNCILYSNTSVGDPPLLLPRPTRTQDTEHRDIIFLLPQPLTRVSPPPPSRVLGSWTASLAVIRRERSSFRPVFLTDASSSIHVRTLTLPVHQSGCPRVSNAPTCLLKLNSTWSHRFFEYSSLVGVVGRFVQGCLQPAMRGTAYAHISMVAFSGPGLCHLEGVSIPVITLSNMKTGGTSLSVRVA